MKREDLNIIKKVISEEGMKKEIGALIDLHHPSAKFPFFTKKVIAGLVIISTALIATIAYFIQDNPIAQKVNHAKDTNLKEMRNNTNSITNSNNITSNETTIDSQIDFNKQSTENSIKNYSNLNTQLKEVENNLSRYNKNKSTDLEKTSNSKIYNKIPVGSKELGNEDNIPKESLERKEKDNNDSKGQKSTPKPANVGVENLDTIGIKEKDKEKNSEQLDTSLPSSSIVDPTANNEDSSASNNGDAQTYKWQIKLGLGYGFMSTGDIRSLNLHNELTYNIAPKWKAGFETSFGRSTTDPAIENTSYIQNGLNLQYSPLKSTSKYQLSVGIGPSFYSLKRSYRQTVSIINGQPNYEYFSEKRTNFGVGIILENRYSLSNTISLGARFNTHQYLNGDAISGLNINLGIKF